ncbi:MAG: nuclear transport factor 2 family protein [Bacteroidota bacterium]
MIKETSSEIHKELWNVLLTIDKALVEKDALVFERLLSADFIGATPTGQFFTKTAYINHHCQPGFGIMALTGEDINTTSIRLYDNTAVVNRRVHSQFKLPTGNVLDYDVQRLEVFIKNGSEWVMVSGQGTQVSPLKQPKPEQN